MIREGLGELVFRLNLTVTRVEREGFSRDHAILFAAKLSGFATVDEV